MNAEPPMLFSALEAAAAHEKWAPEVAAVIGRYLESVASPTRDLSASATAVGPSVEPGWLLNRLPESAPLAPEDFAEVLADVENLILPATVGWQSPSFHGYFPANTSWPAALGDYTSAGLGQLAMLWATSPAATELEIRMLDWVAELCSLPEHFQHGAEGHGGGVIQDSASSGTLVAIVAARERAGGREDLHRMVLYTSSQAHSSVVKGARIAGFRDSLIREIDVDDQLAMRSDALQTAITEDLAKDLIPAIVVATVGSTSTLAVDPVADIAAVAKAAGAWVHVDAAMAGAAAICDEHTDLLDGVDAADSYLFNPHKWWGVTFDCTAMWLADRRPVIEALSITPPYLRDAVADSDVVTDFRDWQIQLGRRFRALKIWFVLRATGADGLRHLIRTHVAEAKWLARRVDESQVWEHAAPARLSLVCVKHIDGSSKTREVINQINNSGKALVTPTEVNGEAVLRLSIGSPFADHEATKTLWNLLNK